MKLLTITAALILAASAASATDCKRQGGGYMCPGNIYVDGSKASSEAEALAVALAKQEQSQEQSQSSRNSNFNGGNTVSISNPKNTTSVTFGVGVNVSLPLASGVQMKNAIDAANWFIAQGDRCTAFKIMEDAPRVRRLGLNFPCGDKG